LDYKGSCYIAVVGNEYEYGPCRDSVENIIRHSKDTPPQYIRATKGYEARQMHLNNWYEKTKHPFILFLDADMLFPVDALERLRRHKKPYVTGFYMRRTIRPVAPVWFEQNKPGVMPFRPMTAILEKNKTYPVGASGWGCVLIHRDVITAMKKILKGEPEIIEDDMDIYPYNTKKLFTALQVVRDGLSGKKINPKTAQKSLITIVNELQPLRGMKDTVGSDIRFPFYAMLAGFPLMGDTGVACDHMANYPVSVNDWLNQPAWSVRDLSLAINDENRKEQERIRKATT
jgi:hypothetical protein